MHPANAAMNVYSAKDDTIKDRIVPDDVVGIVGGREGNWFADNSAPALYNSYSKLDRTVDAAIDDDGLTGEISCLR
jgi:hypothetical protein